VDGTPASVQIEVDGISPEVVVDGERVRDMRDGESEHTTDLTWRMSDDHTDAGQLVPRIEIYQVTDPTDLLSAEHIDTIELAPGATSGTVALSGNALYRAELHVVDSVGNESVSAVLLDASSEDGGGCSAAGGTGGGAGAALLLAALAWLAARARLSAARSRSRG
ncbi:MAG TPA: MYXO-CTERM sorting domain-containing protein, partial [Kofleriaceae bacterium]|nr:MYXO-CTERM sorting domain-containing protein [Kofleriaceae bacterium]